MSGRTLKKVLKEQEEEDRHVIESESEGEEESQQLNGKAKINPFDLLNDGGDDDDHQGNCQLKYSHETNKLCFRSEAWLPSICFRSLQVVTFTRFRLSNGGHVLHSNGVHHWNGGVLGV
ncbi:unnamed protein product [Malus baccata var. baccata]